MDDLKIALPCGFTTKLIKVEMQADKFQCPVCKNHEVTRQECMKITRNKLVIGQASLEIKLEKLSDCEQNLQVFKKDPEYFVDESVAQIKNKIDLRREEIKFLINQKIDAYYEDLLELIEEKKKLKLNEFKKNTEKIDSSKNDMYDLKELIDADIKSKLEFIDNHSRKIENQIDLINTTITDLTDMDFVHNSQEIDVENLFGKVKFASNLERKNFYDQGTFKLVIDDLSKIGKKNKLKIFSKPYTMRNLEWIIKVKLSKNESGQTGLGLYLFCLTAFESAKVSVYADSELKLLHKTVPEKSISIRKKKLFDKNNCGFGRTDLITFDKLMNPKNGFYDAENDSITIEALIRVDNPQTDDCSVTSSDEKIFTRIRLSHGKEKYFFEYKNGSSEIVQQRSSSEYY